MLIDIHCHILHGVDDGARSLANSVHMAEEAMRRGIHKIIATPHHALLHYQNPRERIQAAVNQLQMDLKRQQLDVEVLAGQELRLTPSYEEQWRDGEWQTLGSSPYLLVELPSAGIPTFFWEFVQFVHQMEGKIIIAHPERNRSIISNPDLAIHLIQRGILLQLNASSLLGYYGSKIKKAALQLCKQKSFHFIASDAHGTYERGFSLPSGYDIVRQLVSEQFVTTLKLNASNVWDGKAIVATDDQSVVHGA